MPISDLAMVEAPPIQAVPTPDPVTWEAIFRAEWDEDFDTAWRLMDGLPHPYAWPAPAATPWDGRLSTADVLHVWKRFRDIGADIRHASMFAELERLCRARRARVVVETDERLIPLFARSFPRLEYASRGPVAQPLATVTAQATHERLGRFLRSHPADFSSRPGFLVPDPRRVRDIRRAHADPRRAFVGFSWASTNSAKSLPSLEDWLPILRCSAASFVSLQYGATDADIEFLRRCGVDIATAPGIDLWNDFDGQAALIAACDAVFTISNTTAHLAGAVGTPTIVVLRDAPILTWPRGKSRTAWYPAVRLAWCPSDTPWPSWLRAHAHEFATMTQNKRRRSRVTAWLGFRSR